MDVIWQDGKPRIWLRCDLTPQARIEADPGGAIRPGSVYDAVQRASHNLARAGIDQEVRPINKRFRNNGRRGR